MSSSTSSSSTPFETVIQLINNGHNVFISGVGGCGKSYLIKQLHKHFLGTNKCCVLSSTTGISAFNLGGITIHSWSKLVLPAMVEDVHKWANGFIKRIKRKQKVFKSYRKTQILFVDEVSMLGSNYMDTLNWVCQQLRNNSLPFGGIQLVLGGDMMQLSPVRDGFPFESDSWKMLNLKYVRLTKAWRFDNQKWVDILHRARMGQLTPQDKTELSNRINATVEDSQIPPIFLCSKNDMVDRLNVEQLKLINHPVVTFKSQDFLKVVDADDNVLSVSLLQQTPPEVCKQFLADPTVDLKVGCQVMLLANLDVEAGLTNGTRGIILSLSQVNNSALVRFGSGCNACVKEIGVYSFQLEHQDMHFVREIIPLKLAFATSIHKSQSLTLSSVEMDIGSDIFCEGQSYVALSRCKSLDGLFIRNLDFSKIKPNSKALRFEQEFLKTCIDV
jgi:ATP-dependent DNA helicase PIF1